MEREVAVPELYRKDPGGNIHERRMDVVATWPGGQRFLVDVTIRSPFAGGLTAQAEAGAAAAAGAEDKRRHYDHSVWPFALEPSGRLDVAGLALLAALVRDASNLGPSMPGTGRAGRLREAALRAEIEADVAKCDAARSLTALGSEAPSSLGWATTRAAFTAV